MDLNRIKKLNEEIDRIVEADIDASFKDYIDTTREAQKAVDKRLLDGSKSRLEANPEDPWYKERYEKDLARYMGKHEADTILKLIYGRCHINIEEGGIKEIPTPTNIRELKELVKPGETAIILKQGNKISVVNGTYGDKVELYAAYGGNYDSSISSNAYEYKTGRLLDLSKPNSLSQAVNKGLFDKAWLVYGGSTLKMRDERRKTFAGSVDDLRNPNTWHTDKSGFAKRDLKRELANMTLDVKKAKFNEVKKSAEALRKKFIALIRENDIEDMPTQTLDAVVTALKNIENTRFSSWDSDSMKESQAELEKKVEILKQLVDSI